MTCRLPRSAWLRGVAALATGAATGTGFQPLNWWILVIPGLAALILLVRTTTSRAAAGLGYIFGIGLYSTTIAWVGVMGPPVALLLIAVMSLWCLLSGWAIQCVSILPGAPAWQAMVWTAMEVGAAAVPLGGFGWVRLAWTVVDTPWSGVLRWAGSIGTSFLVALAAGLLARVVSGGNRRRTGIIFVTELLVVTLAATVCVTLADRRSSHQRSVRVLVVQGGVDGTAGPYAMGYARSVTDNHLSQTIMAVAEQKASDNPVPDMVLWPENSTDIDPILDAESHHIVLGALALSQRPFLIGAVTDGPGNDERQTTSLWWPSSSPQPSSTYHKRNLVPFGEWIPARSFFLPLFPILKNIGRQSVPGASPGVLDATIAGKNVPVGVVVCFEVAYDDTVADTVRHGARILAVQSNNSSFIDTAQTPQQWQITRARAIETGRHIVVSTTNSFSGLVNPDGSVALRTREGDHTHFTVTIPLESGLTIGVQSAPWLRIIVVVCAVGVIALSLLRRRRGMLTQANHNRSERDVRHRH
ncbi:apolipoprotein N-acyltransferase [Cutibacterium sp. WCA-380-WT-3A]|uniref:Apolipoprotein N-acyltransferase n=1 Tax=Cutibacterium porci TaxID=2605781 RepID=A0A7K0J664_9ACTN|nr:apolipoprotein N-acyltransferase [Cutibacterium porci]MSS45440.1 apolipoprotein N-acyltransferase [Cutibacterium porci]